MQNYKIFLQLKLIKVFKNNINNNNKSNSKNNNKVHIIKVNKLKIKFCNQQIDILKKNNCRLSK